MIGKNMQKEIKNDYIPFEFKYNRYADKNKKMSLKDKVALAVMTIGLILGSVTSIELLTLKNEKMKEYQPPVSTVLNKKPTYYNKVLEVKYAEKFNSLVEQYGSNDKIFINQLQLLTSEFAYIKIDTQSYEKFNNFLKKKPHLYKEIINILKEKNYPLLVLLLTLEHEKHTNYTHDEKEHLPLIDKAIDSDIDNVLFMVLAKNNNLPTELKNTIGKKMIAKLNENVLLLDQKLQNIYNIELTKIREDSNTPYSFSEEEFKIQKRDTLIRMTKQATNNIVVMYPDTKKYYIKNKDIFKGINKLE